MEWFYAQNNERHGPISEGEFNEMIRSGRIDAGTQVWREGWENWVSLGEAGVQAAVGGATSVRCVECGNTFPTSETVQYQGSSVCSNCKPLFFQKVKEGLDAGVTMQYGGFWIRFVAKVIDGILLGIAGYLLQLPFAGLINHKETAFTGVLLGWALSFLFRMGYSIFLVGNFGATLGKMACGLRIVTASGGKVGYGIAAGRFFAEILSGLILCIGYLMAAFDDEKRTLHDRICNTRVIRKA
ncbi:MAG: RDD family protein [Spartobacteria bacterium]